MRLDSTNHRNEIDIPKITFNIMPLKNIEESKFDVPSSEEEVKEINFYFNYFSEGCIKDSQDSPHESLS